MFGWILKYTRSAGQITRISTLLTIPIVSSQREEKRTSADDLYDIRDKELNTLMRKIKKKGLIIMTGPKLIGKTSLVRQIIANDNYSIYIDLRAKVDSEELKVVFKTVIDDYNARHKEIAQKSLTSKDVAEVIVKTPVISGEIKKTTESSSQELYSPRKEPRSSASSVNVIRALKKMIESRMKSFILSSPSIIVIDEAQTLKLLKKSEAEELFKFMVAMARDGKCAFLLVTSDFDALNQLTGK